MFKQIFAKLQFVYGKKLFSRWELRSGITGVSKTDLLV